MALMLVLGTVMVSGCTQIPGIGGNGGYQGSGQDGGQDSNGNSGNYNSGDKQEDKEGSGSNENK